MNMSSFSSRTSGTTNEAVLFFDETGIVKEMLYGEFEAVLDNVVGISDFAGREIRAVYLLIDNKLRIQSACFFLIGFEANGSADKRWNIPLRHLVDQAGKGPDLGAGPIRLACRSQCPVSWHERHLWDPAPIDGANPMHLLKVAIKANRLGLLEEIEPPQSDVPQTVAVSGQALASVDEVRETLSRQFRQEYKRRVASMKDDFRLRLGAMKTQFEEQLQSIRRAQQGVLAEAQDGIRAVKELLRDEKRRNQQLQSQLDDQLNAVENLRNDMAQRGDVDADAMAALRHQYEVELSGRLEQATQELKEHLDRREVELFYRDEQIGSLSDEIVRVRQERDALIGGGGDQLLKQLTSAGITFVSYHPGLDYLTIPPADIPTYLQAPYAYVAERCGVSEQDYQSWVTHHELPVCNHANEQGHRCGLPVSKVNRPSHFISGESDRCSKHSPQGQVIGNVMKLRRQN
jgi:hypothetical protein